MYYIYLLYSKKTDKIYKGFTEDLKSRFEQHNKSQVFSTKFSVPWKLLYYEAFMNKTDALREEIFLKSGKGRERIKYLLNESLSGEKDL